MPYTPIPPDAPRLRYRAGNTNTMGLILTESGAPVVVSATVAITLEVRISPAGRTVASAVMSAASPANGSNVVILPDTLPPGWYSLSALVARTGQPNFRVGLAWVELSPPGALEGIADATELTVVISAVNQVLSVGLDTGREAITALQASVLTIQNSVAGLQTTVAGKANQSALTAVSGTVTALADAVGGATRRVDLGASASGTVSVDLSLAFETILCGTQTGNLTIQLSGAAKFRSVSADIEQGGSGGFTLAFTLTGGAVAYPESQAFAAKTTAGAWNSLSGVCVSATRINANTSRY